MLELSLVIYTTRACSSAGPWWQGKDHELFDSNVLRHYSKVSAARTRVASCFRKIIIPAMDAVEQNEK